MLREVDTYLHAGVLLSGWYTDVFTVVSLLSSVVIFAKGFHLSERLEECFFLI
jgi:hypothetical protein